MKTIGLLGGMSWQSTEYYYRVINEGIKERLGGFHSAKICLYSVDFAEIEELQRDGDWAATGGVLARAAKHVEAAGADFLVICTNTMHKLVPRIEGNISIPILHIVDATGEKLVEDGIRTVGLLGTRFTMEQAFYKDRLVKKYGLDVVVPGEIDRKRIHDVIYQELCMGHIIETSREDYLGIINSMVNSKGVEAVILGCTEIGLLVRQQHVDTPLYDTARIHAQKAVEASLCKD